MSKKRIIFITTMCLIAILSGAWAGFFVVQRANREKPENTPKIVIYEDVYERLTILKNSNIVLVNKDARDQLIDIEGNIVESNPLNGRIDILYDGYYILTIEEEVLLKRYGKEIPIDSEGDFTNLYQDDDNSEYVSLYYDVTKEYNVENLRIASFTESYDVTKSYLYNSLTGEIYIKGVKSINPIYIGEEIQYFSINKIDDSESIISVNDLKKEISLPINSHLVSDEVRVNENSVYKSGNKNYFIINIDNKYGLIDLEGNIIINPKYDDLYFGGSDSGLIMALSNNKYGVINYKDETILSFDYDGLLIKDNYLIIIKDEKIGVKTIGLENIIDPQIQYNNTFEFRRGSSSLNIQTKDGYLILQTQDQTLIFKDTSKIIDLNNTRTVLVYNYNNIIDDFYLVSEELDNNKALLNIHNYKGEKLSTISETFNTKINILTYSLLNKNTIKISFYDSSFSIIDAIIIKASDGQIIRRDKDNKYTEIKKIGDLYYLKENGELKIFNKDDKDITTLSGEAIYHLHKDKYALYVDTNKWQLIKISE